MTCYSVLAVTPTTEDCIPDYIGPANKARTAGSNSHHFLIAGQDDLA